MCTVTGGVEPEIDRILKLAKRGRRRVVFDADPKKLIDKVVKLIKLNDKQKHPRKEEVL